MKSTVPIPEDPEVPARTAKAEAALKPVHIPFWVLESEQDSAFLEPSSEVQDKRLVDPSLSLSPIEPSLGQGSSR